MTIPRERTRSVQDTREFLIDLLNPKKTPKVPKEIRKRAYWALRHFPSDLDLDYAADGAPEHFGHTEENK